ncbi:hypothetical protein [Streptomyces nigrescens]|uniref:Uncharacterized protein n=1 Tax=Streptomyces nigrescens TaxID=1920 RepID=A0A640T8N5_STRNI|nr:hypothetical protein [Streptomyces libani]WAT94954.1 hypothetical protein STRLI_000626 [Streptomyces libani subsp. libani]GFE20103.1 hypothetical protein Sliba_05560 [Streptomyces libani subsp. libani]GGV85883.1 hypothetical protein GCM10010500_03090 [Streptomyces libani subsp. libani]
MDRIVIDQSKIRVDESIKAKMKPGSEFPRPLSWWQMTIPCWLDASEGEYGRIVLTPNGRCADGRVVELAPVERRRDVKAAMQYLASRRFLDFSDAAVAE